MDIESITPLILTYDEAPNITRTLDKLTWARRIVVIDSGSTDGTIELLASYPQVDVVRRPFDNFADQCNFGLTQVQTSWVLSLDADYELSGELVRELQELQETEAVRAYRVSFVYSIYGRHLRGSLYPPRTVLYRVLDAHYVNEGHGHRVRIPGQVRQLRGVIYHDDRKPLSQWLAAQQRYAQLEAEHLLRCNIQRLSSSDRVRRMAWPAPILVFLHTLILKGCLLDGWPGWLYVLQRTLAEITIALEIIDHRLKALVREH
jgi:glycosyltransferase involved in cell wall biosynthesis